MNEPLERFLNFRIHPAVWLLLGLAVLDVAFTAAVAGFEPTALLFAVNEAGAFVFAAAVVLVAGNRRMLVAGALSLSAVAAVILLQRLANEFAAQLVLGDAFTVLHSLAWLAGVGGALAIGLSIGGIRSRVGWLAVGLGVVVALAITYWQLSMLLPVLADWPPDLLPQLSMSLSLVSGIMWIGWGYLLGAAVTARLRWLTLGVVIIFAGEALNFAAIPLVTPDNYQLFNEFAAPAVALLSIAQWLAFIASAFVELTGSGWHYPTEPAGPAAAAPA